MTVIGRPELVDEAIDHLLNLEEEYVSFCACKHLELFSSDAEGCSLTPPNVFCQMADVVENEAKMAYRRPAASAVDEHRGPSKGFVVREAPWATANEKVCFDTPVSAFLFNQTSISCDLTASQPHATVQAPDMSSSEDFPSFGAPVATKASPWGPKRF